MSKTDSRMSSSLPNMTAIWDSEARKRDRPFIIGVAGGTASGKTTVCDIIVKELGIDYHRVAIISQDCFYKNLSENDIKKVHEKEYNFDHPDAFDWDLIEDTLKDLSEGKPVKIPIYDFVTHSRKEETTSLCAIDIILFEGILIFYHQRIMEYMNMKIFVDTDADTRLARRIIRDIKSRGRDLEGVLVQYQKFVKPAFDDLIHPTKKFADVIIPRGADNIVAIDLIVQHIKSKLDEKNRKLTKMNASTPAKLKPKEKITYPNKATVAASVVLNNSPSQHHLQDPHLKEKMSPRSDHFTFGHFSDDDAN